MNKPLFNPKLPFAPIPTRSSGKFTLVYESLLSNETSINWNIRQIEIVDTKNPDKLILFWTTKDLSENSRYLSKELRPVEAKTLEPGLVLLAYFWLIFEDEKDIYQAESRFAGPGLYPGGPPDLIRVFACIRPRPGIGRPPKRAQCNCRAIHGSKGMPRCPVHKTW